MKDGGASAEGNALAAAHAVLGKERKGMKRLTSILLALLMLGFNFIGDGLREALAPKLEDM